MECIKSLIICSVFAVFTAANAAERNVTTHCRETSNHILKPDICSGGSAMEDDALQASQAVPLLATSEILSISSNSATVEGRVLSGGGNEIDERGICWSTATLPDLTDSCLSEVIAGSGNGPFSMTITGLQGGTIYYVRSFASNGTVTVFGNEKSFKTTSFFYLMTLPKIKNLQ